MPELIRLYIRQSLIGFALAFVFVALLVGFDIAGLRHLVLRTEGGPLAGLVMVMLNAIVFAGVQFAIAVIAMAEDRDPPHGRLRRAWPGLRAPVPVPVLDETRRRG